MQAKIFDFASDKIVKSLNKIDKQDIQNVFSKVSSKFERKDKSSQKSEASTSHQHEEKVEKDLKASTVDSKRLDKETDKPDSVLEIEKDNYNQEANTCDSDGK